MVVRPDHVVHSLPNPSNEATKAPPSFCVSQPALQSWKWLVEHVTCSCLGGMARASTLNKEL